VTNNLFVFFEFLITYKLHPIIQSFICFLWIPYQLQIIYHFSDYPVRALSCALSCFCLGSAWAPCDWFLLLGRMWVAFIERRLSLLILFIIFFVIFWQPRFVLSLYKFRKASFLRL
jgi:hypothetical protein